VKQTAFQTHETPPSHWLQQRVHPKGSLLRLWRHFQ